jgi:Transglycosylase SLT domain
MARHLRRCWIARLAVATAPVHPTTRPAPRTRFAIFAAACIANLLSFPARAEPPSTSSVWTPDPWRSFIDEAASLFSVPAVWIRAVIQVESNRNARAVSPKGAVGLMQLMPDTYAELRIRYGLGADATDPHDNIVAGTAYLREMHERFGTAGFIAAYNAGPQRYEEHLATGRPLPDETLVYVAKITPLLAGGLSADNRLNTTDHASWQQAPLFVEQQSGVLGGGRLAFTPQADFARNDSTVADFTSLVPLPGGLFVSKQKPRGK